MLFPLAFSYGTAASWSTGARRRGGLRVGAARGPPAPALRAPGSAREPPAAAPGPPSMALFFCVAAEPLQCRCNEWFKSSPRCQTSGKQTSVLDPVLLW